MSKVITVLARSVGRAATHVTLISPLRRFRAPLALGLIAGIVCFGADGVGSGLAASNTISTVAGSGVAGYSGDGGPAVSASLNAPAGVATYTDATAGIMVYIADTNNCEVRLLNNKGIISRFAGNAACGFAGDGGAPASAQLNHPTGLTVDANGNLFIADTDNCRIRKVSAGVITTVAGNGTCAPSSDFGPATNTPLNHPRAVAVINSGSNAGSFLIADTDNCRVRYVDILSAPASILPAVGTGACGYVDGVPGSQAQLNAPRGVTIDSDSILYIADTNNCVIRRVALPNPDQHTVTTAVGNAGACGFGGDGGAPDGSLARLNAPQGISVASGKVFIGDSANCRVRSATFSGGALATIAGNGTCGYSGDGGAATSAALNSPAAAVVDSNANVYIADGGNNVVRRIGDGTVDLVVTAVYGDSRGWPGDPQQGVINHRVAVSNQGSSPSPATTLRVNISTSTTPGSGTQFAIISVPPIIAGGTAAVPYSYTVDWSVASGRVRYFLSQLDPVPGETSTSNNAGIRAVGVSLLPWDVNGDGVVNSTDLLQVAKAFGSAASLNWNPDADVNGDTHVNSTDQLLVSQHSGDRAGQAMLHSASVAPTSGSAPLSVTFTYDCYYFEGTITAIDIDVNGDGVWDASVTGGATELAGTTGFTYTTAGTYSPKVRCTDSNGYQTTVPTASVTVS